MVTKLKMVEILIKTVAGRASPFDCKVKRTTNPATGHALRITVVKSGPPVIPNNKIVVPRIGKKIFLTKRLPQSAVGNLIFLILRLARLLPMTIIDSGVNAGLV